MYLVTDTRSSLEDVLGEQQPAPQQVDAATILAMSSAQLSAGITSFGGAREARDASWMPQISGFQDPTTTRLIYVGAFMILALGAGAFFFKLRKMEKKGR